MFENPRRGRQARNFKTNVPKILDLKSSSEQIFYENWRWVGAPVEKYSLVFARLRCFGYLSVLTDQKLPMQKELSWVNFIKFLQV